MDDLRGFLAGGLAKVAEGDALRVVVYISKKGKLTIDFFVELRFIRWIFILDALCSTFPLRSSSAKAEAEAEALH